MHQQGVHLKRDTGAVGDSLKKTDVFLHKVHGERDIARAVEDHLTFGFMHEGGAGADLDRLIGGGKVHARALCRDKRLAAANQVGGGKVVGDDLENRGAADLAGVQHPAAHLGEQRQDGFKGGPVTAREDGDIAGIGPVTAARDRAIDRRAARVDDRLAKAFDLGLVGGGHFHPDLAGADIGQHLLHHRVGSGG